MHYLVQSEERGNRQNKMTKSSLADEEPDPNSKMDFEINTQDGQVVAETKGLFDFLVIKIDSQWKNIFDIMMIIVSCYNVYTNAFYSAYRMPETNKEIIIDQFVEIWFLLDMIFCFFQEYQDTESFKVVSQFKLIALRYLKKSFFHDFEPLVSLLTRFS